jgi:2-desacetyl-2-hydroxyethyl bacteriochlorophyllide A dehydrogenase
MTALDDVLLRARGTLRRHALDALFERGLIRGMRVEFPRPRACRLAYFEEAGPGARELLVESLATVVSPGTERAIYVQAETISCSYPFVPGYSAAGRVISAGPAAGFQPGELIASNAPHASLAIVPAARALRVPEGLRPEVAAMAQLGFIALYGVRRALIEPADRVLVLGCGMIGQLAGQLAACSGATVTMAATREDRLVVARQCGLERTLNVRQQPTSLAEVAADVVIEATGSPQAVHDAVAAVRPGGRVILLGSSRGTSTGVDFGAWRAKGVTLVGAHERNAPATDEYPGARPWRHDAEAFLEFAARGRLRLEPLITRQPAPNEAPQVYSDLLRPEDASVGIAFDWTRDGPWRAHVERASLLRGLRRGALAFAGRPVPTPAPPRRGSRRLRFGVIGCGEIAVENARALRAAGNAVITSTADPDIALARSLAAASGARFSSEVEPLLADPDVDAVLICTPHHLHAGLAMAAAAAGKHVVVEKPMATSVSDCDRMIEAGQRHGVRLSVCYSQRFDPRVQTARQLIEADLLGEPLGTRIVFGQLRTPEYWTSGHTGRTRSSWRSRRETAGGGVLIMNACHVIDYVCWLVGSRIAEVACQTATLTQDVEVEDSVALSYRYENGALGVLEATTTQVGPGTYEQVLRGREGQIVVAPVLRFWSRRTALGYEGGRWHEPKRLPAAEERRLFFEQFAEAVLTDGELPVTAEEARSVQAAIAAAYTAAQERRSVAVEQR